MHSQWLVKWLLKTREDETKVPSFYSGLVIAAIKYLAALQLQQWELQSHLSRSEKCMQVGANWVSVSNTLVTPILQDILNCSGGESLPAWTP